MREIDIPIPAAYRATLEQNPRLLNDNLLHLAHEFQEYLYFGGMDLAISRTERFAVKFNREADLPPTATKDDRLRLVTSVRPPL